MVKIKTQSEVAKFIKAKMIELNLSQSQLSQMIAQMKGAGTTKETVKYNVTKWLNDGETKGKKDGSDGRYPGTEYIYYLAQALEVSIEEILVAGEVCSKYDTRPFSLCAVAKSGSIEQLESLMHEFTPDGTCVGQNYDEYDKTIIDYIIEFEQFEMLKYMLDQKYITFGDYWVNTPIMIGNHYSHKEIFDKIVAMAIKKDDLDLFKRAIKRVVPIFRSDEKEGRFAKPPNAITGYELSTQTIMAILDTQKIFEYLMLPFARTKEEWIFLNGNVKYFKGGGKKEEDGVRMLKTLSHSFNNIFDLALKANHKSYAKLAEIGYNHNQQVLETIESLDFRKEDNKIFKDGKVDVWHGAGCMTILAMQNGEII